MRGHLAECQWRSKYRAGRDWSGCCSTDRCFVCAISRAIRSSSSKNGSDSRLFSLSQSKDLGCRRGCDKCAHAPCVPAPYMARLRCLCTGNVLEPEPELEISSEWQK